MDDLVSVRKFELGFWLSKKMRSVLDSTSIPCTHSESNPEGWWLRSDALAME